MLRDFVILFLGGLSTFLDLIFLVGKFVGFVFGNFGVLTFCGKSFFVAKLSLRITGRQLKMVCNNNSTC